MRDHLLRINQGRIVPVTFRWLWTMLMFFLIAICFQNLPELPAVLCAIGCSLAVFPVWSAYYLLEIDTENRTVGDHTWVMGRKLGKQTSYEGIEKVFINSAMMAQSVNGHGGSGYQSRWREYQAFVKFDDGRKVFLISDRDLNLLQDRLQPMLKKLGCPLQVNV